MLAKPVHVSYLLTPIYTVWTFPLLFLLFRMRYVAAYLLAALGGNENPEAKDIKKILESVGIEADDTRLGKVQSSLLLCCNAVMAVVIVFGIFTNISLNRSFLSLAARTWMKWLLQVSLPMCHLYFDNNFMILLTLVCLLNEAATCRILKMKFLSLLA